MILIIIIYCITDENFEKCSFEVEYVQLFKKIQKKCNSYTIFKRKDIDVTSEKNVGKFAFIFN